MPEEPVASSTRIDVAHPTLVQIAIDWQTRLQFSEAQFVIESPFELFRNGTTQLLVPAERESLGPILALYPDTLTSASYDEAATLLLAFESGAQISVRQDSHFEAWSVIGPGRALIVCNPGDGGEVSVWSDTHEE